MHQFKVEGPYAIPFYQGRAAKSIGSAEAKEFWEHYPHLSTGRGCYIFGIRNRSLTPWYVGRATKTFQQEIFAPHKLKTYARALADVVKGTPVMFLVVSQQSRGIPNVKIVKELEDFLIQTALSANEWLLNVQGTKRPQFAIRGVLRSGSGKASKAATTFKSCMNL